MIYKPLIKYFKRLIQTKYWKNICVIFTLIIAYTKVYDLQQEMQNTNNYKQL